MKENLNTMKENLKAFSQNASVKKIKPVLDSKQQNLVQIMFEANQRSFHFIK